MANHKLDMFMKISTITAALAVKLKIKFSNMVRFTLLPNFKQ